MDLETQIDEAGYKSIGFLDFSNNDLWEVLVPKIRPADKPESFTQSDYPVLLIEHQGDHDDWFPLSRFLEQYTRSAHLNQIIIQLGTLLADYDQEPGN